MWEIDGLPKLSVSVRCDEIGKREDHNRKRTFCMKC